MVHKHRHKKRYYSITDRPWFKIIASVLMAATFIPLYCFVVILMENPGVAPIISIPCVLMLIWVAVKQRQFWWLWIPVAMLCIGMMIIISNPTIDFCFESLYWAASYAMTQWLIVADSKAKHRSRRRKSSHHHRQGPAAPRPRDELLEQLFGDAP